MTTRTVVHLLRHGEVENPKKVLYGRLPDYHLSALGRQMADRAAEALRDHESSICAARRWSGRRRPWPRWRQRSTCR